MISYASSLTLPHVKWVQEEKLLEDDVHPVVVQSQNSFKGPFGWRRYLYVDHTATGTSLTSIEHFIAKQVLPHYANTHTTVSNTSLQTTKFRNEARQIIKQVVGGNENDKVIFCGAGATAAVHKLVHILSSKRKKLVVFIGPYEHHSNILPWKEKAYKMIQVPLDPLTGGVDVNFLKENLRKYASNLLNKYLLVGCFSAGSNITGAVSDDVAITQLLHKFGALSFWDYASAAPHVKIDMNPGPNTMAHKDAIYFSGHKFPGGPQTPGVFIAKKRIFENQVPHGVGGGTVLFVTKNRHQYVPEITEREEGGTPNIIGSIRLGLVFLERNKIGIDNIAQRETFLANLVLFKWGKLREIKILGNIESPRLPIISFLIEHLPSGYFLHHNFVVALLNDLFGIQCRGGCMCAGPYAQDLLGIDDKLAKKYESALENKSSMGMILKPGFVRVSVSYHMSLEETKFLINAVIFIAKYGWRLLPLYTIDWTAASFVVRGFKHSTNSLYSYGKKHVLYEKHRHLPSSTEMFTQAKDLLSISWKFPPLPDPIADQLRSCATKTLRSFMLPVESYIIQTSGHVHPSLQSCRPYQPICWGRLSHRIPIDQFTPLSVPILLIPDSYNSKFSRKNSWEPNPQWQCVDGPVSQFAPYLHYFRRSSNESSVHVNTNIRDSDDDGIYMY